MIKNLFLILTTTLLSSAVFAGGPSHLKVITTLLADSGLRNASNIQLKKGKFDKFFGLSNRTTGYSDDLYDDVWVNYLSFELNGEVNNCTVYSYIPIKIRSGEYYAGAEVHNCKRSNGKKFKLNHEDTDSSGVTKFERIFTNNNTSFRQLTQKEEFLIEDLKKHGEADCEEIEDLN